MWPVRSATVDYSGEFDRHLPRPRPGIRATWRRVPQPWHRHLRLRGSRPGRPRPCTCRPPQRKWPTISMRAWPSSTPAARPRGSAPGRGTTSSLRRSTVCIARWRASSSCSGLATSGFRSPAGLIAGIRGTTPLVPSRRVCQAGRDPLRAPAVVRAALRRARAPRRAVRADRRRPPGLGSGRPRARYSLVVNRMSPSAWTRGNERAMFATLHYLAYLERHRDAGAERARRLPRSSSPRRASSRCLRASASRTRATRVIDDPADAVEAARDLASRSSSSRTSAAAAPGSSRMPRSRSWRRPTLELGLDGTLARPGAAAGRGRPGRADRDPRRPLPLRDQAAAHAGQLQPLPRRLLRAAGVADGVSGRGLPIEGFDPPGEAVDDALRIAAAAGLDLGGVEYLVNARTGMPTFYDVNALSNFVAERARGGRVRPVRRPGRSHRRTRRLADCSLLELVRRAFSGRRPRRSCRGGILGGDGRADRRPARRPTRAYLAAQGAPRRRAPPGRGRPRAALRARVPTADLGPGAVRLAEAVLAPILAVDDVLEPKGDEPPPAPEEVLANARALLAPPQGDTPFGRRYVALMQRDPDLVMAHAPVMKLLGTGVGPAE